MLLRAYQCHKKVLAAKITEILPHGLGFEHGEIEVPEGWLQRFNPAIGGYFVQYEDGYSSYSPAKAFEEGYTPLS